MTKSGLGKKIARKFKLSENDADKIVTIIMDNMSQALSSGSEIEIRGFGRFYIRHCKPYMGRNPRTGEKVWVKTKNLPCFKQGKEIRALLNKPPRREYF